MRKRTYLWATLLMLLLAGACFWGIRGSVKSDPLKIKHAYYCHVPFYNRLGINPVFHIMKSMKDQRQPLPVMIDTVDVATALNYVYEQLGDSGLDAEHPLTRIVDGELEDDGPNIVVVMMESMAYCNLERQFKGQYLTPYLRSLRDSAVSFTRCYAAGVHTNNGLTATLFGYTPRFAETTMPAKAVKYAGLGYNLKKAGYETMAFITGSPQYDNMNVAFWTNGIDSVYSECDYPKDKRVNTFGVDDAYLFDWGIKHLNKRGSRQPFFALFLTVSNHGPVVVPESYYAQGESETEAAIRFADDALRDFMTRAQQTEWGKNTLYLLIGDHGIPTEQPYDQCLSHNHVVCMMKTDRMVPQLMNQLCGQIDMGPTILSLIGLPYENNSLGMDVLAHAREYLHFVSNDHLGVISADNRYYTYNTTTQMDYVYNLSTQQIEKDSSYHQRMRGYGQQMMKINMTAIDSAWTAPLDAAAVMQ